MTCFNCDGSGSRACPECDGHGGAGRVLCPACRGTARLLCEVCLDAGGSRFPAGMVPASERGDSRRLRAIVAEDAQALRAPPYFLATLQAAVAAATNGRCECLAVLADIVPEVFMERLAGDRTLAMIAAGAGQAAVLEQIAARAPETFEWVDESGASPAHEAVWADSADSLVVIAAVAAGTLSASDRFQTWPALWALRLRRGACIEALRRSVPTSFAAAKEAYADEVNSIPALAGNWALIAMFSGFYFATTFFPPLASGPVILMRRSVWSFGARYLLSLVTFPVALVLSPVLPLVAAFDRSVGLRLQQVREYYTEDTGWEPPGGWAGGAPPPASRQESEAMLQEQRMVARARTYARVGWLLTSIGAFLLLLLIPYALGVGDMPAGAPGLAGRLFGMTCLVGPFLAVGLPLVLKARGIRRLLVSTTSAAG